jgi:hypothetical protein
MTTHLIPPSRSTEQRERALAWANHIRSERARLRRALREVPREDSAWMAAGIVLEPPDWAQSLRVYELLTHIRYWGQAKAGKVLLRLGISQAKRVGGLSDRQRRLLVDELADEAGRP